MADGYRIIEKHAKVPGIPLTISPDGIGIPDSTLDLVLTAAGCLAGLRA